MQLLKELIPPFAGCLITLSTIIAGGGLPQRISWGNYGWAEGWAERVCLMIACFFAALDFSLVWTYFSWLVRTYCAPLEVIFKTSAVQFSSKAFAAAVGSSWSGYWWMRLKSLRRCITCNSYVYKRMDCEQEPNWISKIQFNLLRGNIFGPSGDGEKCFFGYISPPLYSYGHFVHVLPSLVFTFTLGLLAAVGLVIKSMSENKVVCSGGDDLETSPRKSPTGCPPLAGDDAPSVGNGRKDSSSPKKCERCSEIHKDSRNDCICTQDSRNKVISENSEDQPPIDELDRSSNDQSGNDCQHGSEGRNVSPVENVTDRAGSKGCLLGLLPDDSTPERRLAAQYDSFDLDPEDFSSDDSGQQKSPAVLTQWTQCEGCGQPHLHLVDNKEEQQEDSSESTEVAEGPESSCNNDYKPKGLVVLKECVKCGQFHAEPDCEDNEGERSCERNIEETELEESQEQKSPRRSTRSSIKITESKSPLSASSSPTSNPDSLTASGSEGPRRSSRRTTQQKTNNSTVKNLKRGMRKK